MRHTWPALLCGAAGVVTAIPQPAGPASDIPTFVTRTWALLSPSEALSSLHLKASATPTAVSLMPGVSIPTDLASKVGHVADEIVDNLVGGKKQTAGSQKADEAKVQPTVQGAAEDATAATCSNPAVRYEWRDLTDTHKSEYVAAVKCLTEKPSKLHCSACNTVYDDLIYVHQQLNPIIHNVGQFLPWHRYYLWIFENLLSSECGYTGPLAWWDETKDAGDFNGAPPFTQTYEGHMPVGSTVCITSGVFANMVLPIGPGSSDTRHCLSRGVNEKLSADITSGFVNICNSYTDFNDMQHCQFLGPHGYGHDAVGGVMSDVATSPGDPAFFLHHAFIDRNWRIWQNVNSDRSYAIGGSTTQNCGNSCKATTLSYVLTSMGLSPDLTIDQVIYTEGGSLCYKYNY